MKKYQCYNEFHSDEIYHFDKKERKKYSKAFTAMKKSSNQMKINYFN